MLIRKSDLTEFYNRNPIQNPVNFMFTEKQCVDGQYIDDLVSEQNFRHFSNLVNARVFGSAFKRYGKKLSVFAVREQDEIHRHHLHGVIEKPKRIEDQQFLQLLSDLWRSTRFGYDHVFLEVPINEDRHQGWVGYSLKERSKTLYSDSIDWSNSTCFVSGFPITRLVDISTA